MLGKLKRLMINQCGPVFMGKKPAALFPLGSAEYLDCLSALLPRNITMLVLRETEGHLLALMYDEIMLTQIVSDSAICSFLSGFGYPAAASMFRVLENLKTRFSGSSDFPHEIGLFLGYPLEDVTGFIRHKGQNYKLCGYWKVYGDVEQAKRLFQQYDVCRNCMERYCQGPFPNGKGLTALPKGLYSSD